MWTWSIGFKQRERVKRASVKFAASTTIVNELHAMLIQIPDPSMAHGHVNFRVPVRRANGSWHLHFCIRHGGSARHIDGTTVLERKELRT